MTPRIHSMALCCAALLAGCGGGGVEPADPSGLSHVAPAVSRKYAGVWRGCLATPAGPSYDETYSFERVSDVVLRATAKSVRFEAPGCQGQGTAQPEFGWNVELLGTTRVVDGVTLDEVVESDAYLPARKSLLGVDEAGRLRLGAKQPRGADGFPTRLTAQALSRP